jgi:hypothetical protein
MIARFGKSLEAGARILRPFLLPSYRRAFTQLVARGLKQHPIGTPIVCCDFSNPAIDSVGGRYYFSLVRDLIDAGYFPVFTARRSTLSTFGTSALKSLLLPQALGVVHDPAEIKQAYFLITDTPAKPSVHAQRTITVDYQWRLASAPNEIEFPVFVHPWIASGTQLPHAYDLTATRSARLFFGGNTESGKYDKDVLRDTYQMLSRREMLKIAEDHFPAHQIHRPREASTWLASPESHTYVICETQHCKIPQNRWIDALAKADFFLACPGVGMPLCHNLIESLAAGTIPILQYADYLPDPLRNGIDCLTFTDAASLGAVLETARTMTPSEIHKLRANVMAYYQEFLAPGRFAQRLFSGPDPEKTLLLNAYRIPR